MQPKAQQNLARSKPEAQGIASSVILDFVHELERQVHDMHGFMLLRHGHVIAEGCWSPYRPEYQHMLFSLSKSFTSTAVGLAIEEGHFSIDDSVLSFFPDELPSEPNDFLKAMRIRHLLSMSTGHADDTWEAMNLREDGNWIKAFFNVPVKFEPGTHFLYNTGATYMLSAIVQKITGVKLVDYLQARLFEPLGIENATWQESPQHINLGGIGLSTKIEDMACFGQLYLQKGLWGEERILPEAWVAEATSRQIANGNSAESDWTQGYGYQFWRCRHNAYWGDGVFGQYCVVMPDQDAVLAITGGTEDMQEPLEILWETLLPAMQDAPLAEDAAGYDALSKKLASLSLDTLEGKSSSPIAEQVSGRSYAVDDNELHIERITLNFAANMLTLTIKNASDEQVFSCGYTHWEKGQIALFEDAWISSVAPILSKGFWTADDSFAMQIRFYELPFYHRFILYFMEDEMMIETRVNMSFDAIKTLVLTAHAT